MLRVTFCAIITVSRSKGQQYCMFLDKKTILKNWLLCWVKINHLSRNQALELVATDLFTLWRCISLNFIPFYYCHQVPTQGHSGSQRAPRPCCFCFRVLSVLHQSPARHLSIFQIHATRCARHSMLHSAEDCCLTFSGELCFAGLLEYLWNVLARLKRKGAFKDDLKCWSSFIQQKLNGFD